MVQEMYGTSWKKVSDYARLHASIFTVSHPYVLHRTHVRGCVRFHLYARSIARVLRKLQSISRLHRCQLRCQYLLLCYLQGQSKAHAVTIAKRRLELKRKLIAYKGRTF